ncbi:hypothetical protein J6590_013242 [Homalodisca vitripennis]|nr:hypothetical protein J6590_013242 [Homalodisca vitripennis]
MDDRRSVSAVLCVVRHARRRDTVRQAKHHCSVVCCTTCEAARHGATGEASLQCCVLYDGRRNTIWWSGEVSEVLDGDIAPTNVIGQELAAVITTTALNDNGKNRGNRIGRCHLLFNRLEDDVCPLSRYSRERTVEKIIPLRK